MRSNLHSPRGAGGWTNGAALSYIWRTDDIARLRMPAVIAQSLALSTLAAFLTLAIELMLGVLIWVRSARPLVVALGVVLHLSIDLTLRIVAPPLAPIELTRGDRPTAGNESAWTRVQTDQSHWPRRCS